MLNTALPAPVAEPKPISDTRHGITRTDPYAWLRDDNWQNVMRDPAALAPDIKAYLNAENAYCAAVTAPCQDLQQTLYTEMRGRILEDDSQPPRPNGAFSWFSKFETGGEHPLICRGRRDGSNAQIIINGNQEAEGEAYFKIINSCPSPNQTRLAYAVDVKGSELFSIYIRDIEQGKNLPDCLISSSGAMAWAHNGETLFYVQLDENHRPCKVMKHQIGTPSEQDICVYEEPDSGFFVSLQASRSGDFIFINSHDHQTSEVHILDAHHADSAPICLRPREIGLEYEVSHDAARQRFIIVTNQGAAVDFKIMIAPVSQPENWDELVPHQTGQLILDAIPFENHLAILSRVNALPSITIVSLADNGTQVIEFDEEIYALELEAGYEYATAQLRFRYSSPTQPEQIYDYDMATHQRQLIKEQIIPSGHHAENYKAKRLWATAQDGARIPLSVLHHKDTPLDGSAPVLLYGYGSYGITIPASFSSNRLSLVDRGFIYVIAHVRGSKAMGHDWFLQGRGKTKKKTFTDFIAAAEFLIAEGLTQKGNISIHGGSAGGLLVGAAVNLAPDLFKSAIAEVPFVDALNTMLDASLPLTPPEWPEWGNPITSEDDYKVIADYAPYENIQACAYPHILATGGLTDPRVTYWEPAKWVARLRATRTDSRLTLLRIEMEAGHGGKAGRFNQLDELAFVYSFIISVHALEA